MDRVSKGVFRHLGRDRAVSSGEWSWWAGGEDPGLKGREAYFTKTQSFLDDGQPPRMPLGKKEAFKSEQV